MIWSIFESRFGIKYQQSIAFVKGMLEKHYKLRNMTPHPLVPGRCSWFKAKGIIHSDYYGDSGNDSGVYFEVPPLNLGKYWKYMGT